MPYWCRLVAESTEYAGHGAGRAIYSVLTGRTSVDSPDAVMISCANSNQVQSPASVTCTIPLAFFRQSRMRARARSTVYVGQPRWSLTTSRAGRSAASRKIVSGKHLPPTPNTHDVRAMQQSDKMLSSFTSACAFEFPYTPCGLRLSSISYGDVFLPSNT